MNKKELKEAVDLIRKRTPRSWILVVTTGISEVLMTAALARCLRERSGYPVTLCAKPQLIELVNKLYPGRFIATVGMSDRLVQGFTSSDRYNGAHFDIDYPVVLDPDTYGNESIEKVHRLIYKRKGTSGLTQTDLWRYMLHLGWDDSMEAPSQEFFRRANPAFDRLGLEPGKFILILPGSNREKPLSSGFWHAVQERAARQGIPLVACVSGARLVDNQLNIRSENMIEMDLPTTVYAAYHSRTLVTPANGMAQLMAFLEHEGNNPVMVNSIIGDMYFARSGRYQGTFVRYDGVRSLRIGNPEMVSASCCLSEWHLPGSADSAQCSELADCLFDATPSDPFFVKPEYAASRARHPELRQFGEDGQFITDAQEIYF